MKIKQLLFPCLMSVIVLASCSEDKIAEQYQSINSSNKTEETVKQEEKEYEFPDYFLEWKETSRNVVDRINSGEEVPLDELNDAHIKSIAAQFYLKMSQKVFIRQKTQRKFTYT